jgi:hypothetical protein
LEKNREKRQKFGNLSQMWGVGDLVKRNEEAAAAKAAAD